MRTLLLVVGVALVALLSFTSAAPVAVSAMPAVTAPPPLPPLSIVPPPPSGSYPDFVFVGNISVSTMEIDLGLAQTGTWNVPNTTGVGIYDPEQWVVVFYFNNITVPTGKTVRFKNHPSRAAVALLAYNSMLIQGSIDVSGGGGGLHANGVTAEPGPGGYRGSRSGIAAGTSHAAFGPGGAFSLPPGGASYGRHGTHATVGGVGNKPSPLPGVVYGNALITQLIGGSGGGGFQTVAGSWAGGGAGGGAILLAANQAIAFANGSIRSFGGSSGSQALGVGSGGSIRIVADSVDIPDGSNVSAYGVFAGSEGIGRIRIERNNFGGIPGGVNPPASIVTGNAHNSVLFQTVNRQELRIISVAGQTAPLDPRAGVLGTESADIFAPAPGAGDVVIEGRNVPMSAPIFLRATAVSGTTQGEISVTGSPVGNDTYWTRTVSVDFGGGYTCLQARAVLP